MKINKVGDTVVFLKKGKPRGHGIKLRVSVIFLKYIFKI